MGKGSTRRPKQITEAELDARWRAWFPKPAEDELAVEMACFDCLFIPCLCPSEPEVREGDSYEVQTRRWAGA